MTTVGVLTGGTTGGITEAVTVVEVETSTGTSDEVFVEVVFAVEFLFALIRSQKLLPLLDVEVVFVIGGTTASVFEDTGLERIGILFDELSEVLLVVGIVVSLLLVCLAAANRAKKPPSMGAAVFVDGTGGKTGITGFVFVVDDIVLLLTAGIDSEIIGNDVVEGTSVVLLLLATEITCSTTKSVPVSEVLGTAVGGSLVESTVFVSDDGILLEGIVVAVSEFVV